MKFLCESKQIATQVSRLIRKCATIRWAVAWASSDFEAYSLLRTHADHIQQMVVGVHFYQTQPEFIEQFAKHRNVRFVMNPSGVFHPKLYLFEHDIRHGFKCFGKLIRVAHFAPALKTIVKRGRQPNISFFAFTATPKAKTLEVFGQRGPDGKPHPFHLYSMRQAIEEGFILDVLLYYTTYRTYYRLIKAIKDDPKVVKSKAAKALARFMSLHPHNIAQKTEVMVEHFRTFTRHKIGARAKAMVVTSSRLHAVRYSRAAGFRRAIEPSDRRRRILALCLGGIGDTVLAFAALRDLRQACPDDHITALAMWPQSAELLTDLGIFDEVLQHNFQKERLWRSFLTAVSLRGRHFDVSIVAFPANRFEYNVTSRLLGARRRMGHNYLRGGNFGSLRWLLTDRIDQKPGRHTVDENRELIGRFTGRVAGTSVDIRLGPLDPKYHEAAARMLAHLNEPLLGIHPGCSTYKGLEAKRWPAERFGELCGRAHCELGLQPVVFGMPDEIELKLQIQAMCPEVYLSHGPTIRHTAALMARCAAFVSNDSALAHIASAVDVPVVMLCGPTDLGEVRPYGSSGRVLTAGLGCSPCFRVSRKPLRCTNPEYQACLKALSVDSVLVEVADCLPVRRLTDASPGLGLHKCLARSNNRPLPVLTC